MASFALALFPCCENEVTFDLLIHSKATLTCLLPIWSPDFFLPISLALCLSVCVYLTLCSLMKSVPGGVKGQSPRYTHAHVNTKPWREHIHTHADRTHADMHTSVWIKG